MPIRITSIRVTPVALILAIIYAVGGFFYFLIFALYGSQNISFPLGIVAPLVNLSVIFHSGRSTDVLYNVFLFLATVVAWGLTGWLTGTAAVLLFNFVAKQTGGIDAKYVTVVEKVDPGQVVLKGNHPSVAESTGESVT